MKKTTFSKFTESIFFLLLKRINNGCLVFNKIEETGVQSLFLSKKNSLFHNSSLAIILFFLFTTTSVFSQLAVPFSPRLTGGNIKVKGDIVLIGNSIIKGQGLASPYNGTADNNAQTGEYIDVDGIAATFSSSTAKLAINNSCKRIVFAGLYWASIYPNEVATDKNSNFVGTPRLNDWNQVKLTVPDGTVYDLTANKADPKELIFDGYNAANINNSFKDSPIICFKDVTSQLALLAEADGNYTLANVRATRGQRNGGCAAGWTLVIIYESPTLPSKFISVFDGYAGVQGNTTVDIPVSGFKTLPSPFPVIAKIGVSALEGDLGITGDTFQFKAAANAVFTPISDAERTVNNFFNSKNTNNGAYVLTGNPTSKNLLGYDIANVKIPNPSNTIIPNGETAGALKLTTSGDGYGAFVTSFAIDIIEPTILLTKIVKDNAGNDASNLDVTLGQVLNYTIGFQNQGNDDAKNFTIKDILPINVNFNYPADIVSVPAGVTHTYNAATRTIIFTIPNNLVKAAVVPGGPFIHYDIVLKVQVVPTCNDLSDACENRIQNTAYATYKGSINPAQITDDPSLSSFTACNLGTPQSTNFLVGVKDCLFTKNVVLCGSSASVTASNGYASYNWTGPGNFTATGQTVTVTTPGVYKVFGVGNKPCTDYNEEITVAPFGGIATNPVIPFADEVVVCPNDGKKLPNIFLCGANATRLINTNVSDGSTIVWEKLNEASCSAVANPNCANENTSCTWSSVGTGQSYTANSSGQFRVTFNYAGGCFNRFYFNVYQNVLSPTETHRDIICTTKGNITIGGVPAGYEYSLDGTTYQPSNSFSINSAGLYTVYIKQIGVTTNPCIFTIPNILIRQRNFTVTAVATQPLCFGDKGSITVAANDAYPQYNFSIFKGATQVAAVGPITPNEYTFPNLTPAIYTIKVTTSDGCTYSEDIEIKQPGKLTATSTLSMPLTDCSDGEIKVVPNGGTAPYFYFVNGSATFQSTELIPVTTAGTYSIRVVDSNNCEVTTSIIVAKNLKPVFTVTSVSNNDCYGVNGSEIKFNVTSANGYTLSYSIDNGVTFQSGTTFSNLPEGTYTPVLKYTLSGAICTSTEPVITFTGPASAVTGSGGVSELAGCEAGTGFGKLRITNAEGGTPFPGPNFYLYSFDGGATYQTSNEKYVAPGTYTLVIKDAKGCTFTMPGIVLDPKPVDPTIAVDPPTFSCNGSATTTVTVTNPVNANFSYEYYLDGVLNTNVPANVFANVPTGNHTVSVKYKLVSVPTYSNLLYENFGYGDDTTSPGINTTYYCFERQVVATQCNNAPNINDGDYSVTASVKFPFGTWVSPIDHTAPKVPAVPKGRYLAVNIGDKIPVTAILYQKQIKDIIPGQGINVELFAINLLRVGTNGFNPDLRIELVDGLGNVIDGIATGDIAKANNATDWIKFGLVLNPGANTNLNFVIRSNVQQTDGNDVAIDDISVYQLPKSCITQKDFPITVDSNKAFTASVTGFKDVTCAGANNGEITIVAQNFAPAGFYYSLDGAAFVLQATSPLVISNLSAGNHSVRVQYDLTASPCLFTLPQVIKTPTAVTLTASVTKTATCTTGASITAVGGGGTPAYQYELRAADGVTVITAFTTNPVFTNLPTATYTVFIRDANLCVATTAGVSVIVTAPPTLTAALDASSDLCYDTVNKVTFVVNVTGGTAPFSYSLDGQAGQTSNIFTDVVPGTHSILVTDSNNCTTPIANIEIAPELKAVTTATKALDCSASSAAIITGTMTGGKAPFTATVLSGAGPGTFAYPTATTFTYTTAVASTYQFQIVDANGCITTTTATIDPITNPTATAVGTDPSCNNGTDGQITITGAGGSGGFTYSFNGGAFTATPINSGLNAFVGAVNTKDYTYQVKDSKGCLSPVYTVTLNNPTVVVASASIVPNTTCSTTTVITSAGTGGSGTYTYSFNGSATYTATNTLSVTNTTAAQTITYSVKDAKGCIDTKTINIPAYNPPTDITFSVPAAITCTTTSTSITLTPVGGVAPFTYVIISGPTAGSSATGTFTGLTPGNYVFEVKDANGCTKQASKTIAAAPTIAVAGAKTDIKCFGTTDGTATFTITGASSSGNYNYTLSPNVGTVTKTGNVVSVTGLPANTYTLTVTDITTGCISNTASVTIAAPSQITFTLDATKISCNNKISTISFPTLSGGTPGYTYAYATSPSAVPSTAYGSVTSIDTAVLTNTIDVYVKDINGCIEKKSIVIGSETEPTIDPQTPACYAGTPITVTITGTATGTTTYSKDGINFQASPTFTLSPGSYTLTIKDGFGCIASIPYVIAPQLTITATPVVDVTCTADTTINFAANGGTGAYTYAVSFNGGAYAPTTSPYVTAIAGTYTFRVTDSATPACQAVSTDIIVVTKATVLTLTTTKVDVKCKGDNTGSITVTATSGKAPFTYSKDGGTTYVASNVFANLIAGTYNIMIKDDLGCTSASTPITILEPLVALSATAAAPATTTCSTATTVTVTASNGTPGYTYSFNGGAFTTTNTYVVNDNGTSDQTVAYQVKDANGCLTVSQNIVVKKLNPPTGITFSGLTPITCNATTTNITLTAVNGVAPYSYIIVSGTTINTTGASTGIFTGLLPGDYIFEVTDANGCSKQEAKKIAPVAPIVATAIKLTDVKCFGDSTGSISYNVSGFATTYSYKVNALPAVTGQTATTFTRPNLGQGIYSVVFTDETTLCTATTSITITQPTAALTASLTGNVNANCKTPYAVVTITATGGTPNYKYAFVQNGVPPVASDYVISNIANLDPTVNTQWDVWVQDANGCITAVPVDVTIVLDPKPTVTTSVVGQCTATGSTFQIVAVGAGGVAPYIYSINTGVAPSPADTFTVAPGTYTVTVTDANGCTGTSTVTVNEVLTATAILTKDLDCSATPDGTISVTVLGGLGPFSYQVKIGAGAYGALVPFAGTTFTYPVTTADTYQFQITDSNVPACTKVSNVITVNPIVYPLVTLVAETQTIKCNGDNTGIITVTIDATQGVGPYEYSINGGTYQASNIFTGLTAGLYNVTVRDSKGCVNTVPASITIAQPDAITFDLTNVDITCDALLGSTLGSITIANVLGGTASIANPFRYFITNNFGDVIAGNPYTAVTTGREDHTFTIINYGVYTVNAVDANGCSFSKSITMASPPSDLTIDVTTITSDCTSGGTAIVKAISAVGSGNYEFGILEFNYAPYTTTWLTPDVPGGDTRTFINLVPGVTYTFVVHDLTTDCYFVKAADQPIAPASSMISTVTPNNVTCKNANDGSVTFVISGFDSTTTSVDYQLFTAFTNVAVGGIGNIDVTVAGPYGTTIPSPGSLFPGQYYIQFTENGTGAFNGCKSASAIFEIKESAVALTVTASVIKNENCNNLGIINALAKDGTAPYLYMVTNSATAPLPGDPAWAATSTFTKAAGTYYVHAKDAYGCIQPSAVVNLIKDPTPLIDLTVTDNCVVEGTFELNVALTTVGIAPYTIVVNGSAAQNVAAFPYVVSGLNSGLQTVTVTDANGCFETKTITIAKPLVATPAITALPTCTDDDGVITMSGTGGTGSYTYTINPMPATAAIDNTTGIISGLPADTYTVTMTDTATPTNCSATAVVTLIKPTPVVFTTTTTPALCVGDANGSVTVILDVSNDNPTYTYEIIAGPQLAAVQSTNVFTGLLAGTYTVRVNSGRGCFKDDATVVVAPATPIVATVTLTTKLTCDTGNNAQKAIVTVTGSGGSGTYEYSFDGINYSTLNTYETYSPELVTGYVRDANGCVDDDQITVNTLNPPTEMDIAGTDIWCAVNTTSTVTITNVQNGVGPFTYQNITSATSNTTGIFLGLTPGDYVFQVTDDNGCTYQELYTVKDVTPIVVLGAIETNISCNGLNGNNGNGSATYTVTGFSATGNYTIVTNPVLLPAQITNVNDVITLTGLTANTYTVTVTDITTGCFQSDSVTLTEPVAITFTATPSNVFCTQTVSQITVSGVTGGTGVYTYAAVKAGDPAPTVFDTNPVISVETNLTDLVWDVYVKDANGCVSVKVIATVIRDAAPTITVPAGQCFTGAPLTTDLSTVTTTYNGVKSYTVNGFPIATSTATFNGPGTYTLGIKDDHGCEAFVDYTIEKQLLATATLTKDLYCVAPIDATIEVEIQDGVAPYSYQMYLGAATVGGLTPVVGTSFTATTTVAGTYHFVITDSNGASCAVTTNDVVVTTPITPTFTYSQINVSCTSGNDGSFTVIPADGLVPYTYKITAGAANTTGDTSGIYTGLAAGVYTVQVTDAKGCVSATQNVTITEPIQLTATASLSLNTTCSVQTIITVVGHDGTPTGTGTGYYYSFDNGVTYDTSNTFTVNDNGTIQTIKYAVKDGNGCTTVPQDIVINPLNKPTDLAFALTVPPTCPVPTATVTLTATNGVGTLQYETIAPSVVIIAKQASNVFAGLSPGDYTFQVTDANGCTYQELYKVEAVVNIEVSGQLIADMTCNTGDDGKVTFDVSKFSSDYNYTVTKDGNPFIATVSNSTLASIPLTGLGFGVYEITVFDNTTLCDKTATVTVAQPSIVTIAEVSNINANCTSNALVQVIGGGGTPDYTYAYVISGAGLGSAVFSTSDSASLDPAVSLIWDFYAKDSHGCISAPLLVTIALDPLPAGFTAVATQCPSATGTYTITVTDGPTGMGPYTYSIGAGFQSGKVFIVNAPGTYDLIVKDKFGCEVTFPAAITILEPIAIEANITALPSCSNNDGSITASATGGSGNYSYQIDGGLAVAGATATFPGLASGAHTILVTDTTTNCTDTVTLNLSAATIVTGFGLTMTPVSCNGGTDGTVTATMTTPATGVNDNPVYRYTLTGTDVNGPVNVGPQDSNLFTGLRASIGNYTVNVISGRGCPATATIVVTEPGIITVPAPTVVQFGCTGGKNGANFATITVAGVTGGSGTYTIYDFIKNGVSVQRGSSTSYIETNYAGGTYVVTVSDDKDCQGSTIVPIVIDAFIPLDKINVVVNNYATCTNDEDITVTAVDAANNPILGITYVITETTTAVTQTNNTGVFTGLLIGNYRITATNPLTSCTIETVHYVINPNTFQLNVVKISDVVCFGSNEGNVKVTLVDLVTPPDNAGIFDYVVTGPVPSAGTSTSVNLTLSNLTAGLYTVTAELVNTPFCLVTTSFTIDQPAAALVISETHTEITCVPGNDGTISVSAIGGWDGVYEFEVLKDGNPFSAYSATTYYENLSAGIYSINVRDSKGCVKPTTVTLDNPTPITLTISPLTQIVSCNGDKSATIIASGVTGGEGSNYSYTLNYMSLTPVESSGPQTDPAFTGLGAGTYTITVTDGWGCTATSAQVTITEPTIVEASLVLATSQTCLTQSTLTLTASGGTAPYTYSADASFAAPIAMVGNTATFFVPNGIFHYYVRDFNNCVSLVSNDVPNPKLEDLDFDIDVKNAVVKCRDDLTGVIVAVAKGGLGNYIYTLVDATNTPIAVGTQDSPGNFTQLPAGIYYVNVVSGDCELTKGPFEIKQPDTVLSATPTTVSVTCNGNGDGKIIISAAGGTGIIKYAISPNLNQFFTGNIAGGHSFNNLTPGPYDVIVQDENGCFELFEDIVVVEPVSIDASVVAGTIQQEYCVGDKTGAFRITISGGTAPYSTSLDEPKGTYVLDQVDFAGLVGGTHTVYIQDANMCTFELIVQLDKAVNLVPVAVVNYDCVDDMPANKVTVTIDPSNNPADVVYSLDDNVTTQTSNVFTNLTPGDHYIIAHHINTCIDATETFTIDQVDPLTMTLAQGGLNEIVATTTGGSGVYQYTFNGEDNGSNNKYIYYHTGDYTVTVTDTNGCTFTVIQPFVFIDIKIPNIFTPNGDGTNDTWKPTNTENYPDIQFVVYDRYSREVGRFGAGEGWDGTYKGTELPMGDYWYILKLKNNKDDREFIGHFTLYR